MTKLFHSKRIGAAFLLLSIVISMLSFFTASAENESIEIVGTMYEFGESGNYTFSKANALYKANSENAYGNFYINGNIENDFMKLGIRAYVITDPYMDFYYSYSDKLLKAGKDDWHLVEDDGEKINDVNLNDEIGKGVIIVQTSKDRVNWLTVSSDSNIFSDTPVNTSPIYTASDIQLINGCFYRILVAYKLGIRTKKGSFLFFNTDKYDYKKICEVYEFYACTPSALQDEVDPLHTYNIGDAVRTKEYEGYYGEKDIENDDPHYNVSIGQFFVSGYTDTATDSENNVVFLKNVGDKVTLWFNLKENINAIKGNADIKVTADRQGYDKYFQTPTLDFGRGTLIIRYTDYNNVAHEPVIYTNYLEANASVDADTKVSLFEEGDYEIALDYELTEDKLIDSEYHYRIFFKFSIRNGNCMVYPFDLLTGSELTNSSLTENGFKLDFAKSRYLKVVIKRERLTDSADGLIEDTRFNGPAKDDAEYKEEGIYTITVTNQYTRQITTKKIYVGSNSVLKAFVTTGLSIPEINALVADGAVISNDGTIKLGAISPEVSTVSEASDNSAPFIDRSGENNSGKTNTIVIVALSAFAVCTAYTLAILIIKKRKAKKAEGGKNA